MPELPEEQRTVRHLKEVDTEDFTAEINREIATLHTDGYVLEDVRISEIWNEGLGASYTTAVLVFRHGDADE